MILHEINTWISQPLTRVDGVKLLFALVSPWITHLFVKVSVLERRIGGAK